MFIAFELEMLLLKVEISNDEFLIQIPSADEYGNPDHSLQRIEYK
jgi:hypothetical protein